MEVQHHFLSQVRNKGTVTLDAREDSGGKMQTRYLIVEVIISCKNENILNPTSDFRLMISSGTLWLLWTTEAPCGPREQLWEMAGPPDFHFYLGKQL